MSTFEELCTVAKIKPKAGESLEVFAKRLTDKIGKVPNSAWESLSEAAQEWHNDTSLVLTDKRKEARAEAKAAGEDEDAAAAAIEVPALEGFEPVAEKEDELAGQEDLPLEEEEKVDPETGEVTEAKAKPKKEAKAKKEKPAPKAKPAKAEKPAKVAKEKKPAKAMKKSGEARGKRSLFEDDQKVKVLVKPNPHRDGSTRWKAYAKLKDGATVSENVRLGVPRQQIWSMMNREIVKVV